jgi:hypothetical protein
MQTIISAITSDVEIEWKLTVTRFEEYIHTEIFHIRWWFLFGLFVVCVYIWWKLIDKSRLSEILLYTLIITLIILILDELGEELTLWDYPVDIVPLFPPISAINLSCLPAVYSIFYQLFRTWKSFIIASILMVLVFCFIAEPFFVWAGVYQMIKWKSYYGLPIYFFIAIIAKAVVSKIYSIAAKS